MREILEKTLFLDHETTFHVNEKKQKDPSPYIASNYLVSTGFKWPKSDTEYLCFKHSDQPPTENAYEILRTNIYNADLLVAHNIKFELSWLKAVGIEYTGKVADTMIREYVLAKGQKLSVSLEESCIRNKVQHKKSELVDKYLKDNVGFEAIPWEIVQEYGIGDILSLEDLYYNQIERLNAQPWLWPTVDLMEEFCRCLTDIEANGLKVDVDELDKLERDYKIEYNQLVIDIEKIIKDVMGDTPINIDSPEQLSWVMYSRKVNDKRKWKQVFNLGSEIRGSVIKPKRPTKMSDAQFVHFVKEYSDILYKTQAVICEVCNGSGKDFATKSCRNCTGNKYTLLQTKTVAGLKFIPKGSQETAVGGFSTSKETLERLLGTANELQRNFITKITRKNAINTYLNTFIDGIRRGLRNGNIIHPSFLQCVTVTGRLSSRNPNFHNQPRGNTFPVRRCIVSRFRDGVILSGDAKQLEFRIAGELSGDEQIFADVISGIDVHSATSKHTGLSRQDSKSHTFAPVYGATEAGKADNIAAYYIYFKDHYAGLYEAHKEWAETVLSQGGLFRLPSGREFYYPNTYRYRNGSISNSTIIKNYPVQGFATADLIPIFCINTWKYYKKYGLKSLIINEVHDDVTADIYPGELEIAAKLMVEAFHSIYDEAVKRWDYTIKMPLEIELKVGPNGLDQKEYKCQKFS